MARKFDLVIRGGTIVDGRGGEPFIGDVAVEGDAIVGVGRVDGTGDEEIDATGLMVTPGFVDIHTHYDAQVIWADRLSPSSEHGVTTVVMGNCGVGFAPCKPEDHERLIELMEGVEDIPGVVMTAGLTWDWETFPEYLDAVDARRHDIDVGVYFPHAALRVYVMGERAVVGAEATPDDLARMADLTREAMQAGAVGFSSSRTLFHRDIKGNVIPTAEAGEKELLTVAKAMQSAGHGVLQVANDFKNNQDVPGEFQMMTRVAKAADRPLTLPIAQMHEAPELYREVLGEIERANRGGLKVTGQVLPRGVGMLMGLELTMHPFIMCPSYTEIADLPLAERVARMRDPEVRERIVNEPPSDPSHPLITYVRNFGSMFEGGDPIDYEPELANSIAQRAARKGVAPAALAYDMLLEHDGHAVIFQPFVNYAHGNLDAVASMIRHDNCVVGLGDGGAHCGVICDASYTTFMLSYWTRDRVNGAKLSVAEAVKALSQDTAQMIGFNDRGVLASGYRADINLIDYERLTLHAPKISYDLPAGGRRLTQRADGYVATLVGGQIVYRNGEPTGALPGRLVRGPQPSPLAAAA